MFRRYLRRWTLRFWQLSCRSQGWRSRRLYAALSLLCDALRDPEADYKDIKESRK